MSADEISVLEADMPTPAPRAVPTRFTPVNPMAAPLRGLVDFEIEAEVVRACLQRSGFAQRVLDRLPDDIFTNEVHAWMMRELRALMNSSRGRMKTVPRAALENRARQVTDIAKRDLYLMSVRSMYSKPVEFEAYAELALREYAAFQMITTGMRESLSQHKSSTDVKRTMTTLSDAMRRAEKVLSDVTVYDYASEWKTREATRKSTKDFGGAEVLIRTGIPDLDDQIKFTPGTVTGFIAPFKRYKSIVLNHIGFAALLQGYNVVHVTLENTVEMTAARYDARFSGLTMDQIDMLSRTDADSKRMIDIMQRVDSWPQRIKIIAGTAKSTTVSAIEAEIEAMEDSGFSADAVVLDYGNIFAPSVIVDATKDHRMQEQIVWDMQHLAKKGSRQRVVITAFQANRDAIKEKNVKMDQVGQSTGISQAVDAAIAINQDDVERQQGIIRLSPMFLRYGPIKKTDCELNSDLARMCIDVKSDSLWGEALTWDTDG